MFSVAHKIHCPHCFMSNKHLIFMTLESEPFRLCMCYGLDLKYNPKTYMLNVCSPTMALLGDGGSLSEQLGNWVVSLKGMLGL
jgi:hypothetical protein